MSQLRTHLLHHRALAAWLIAAALLMRLLVPAGFMPVFDAGSVRLAPCAGIATPLPVAEPMNGMAHGKTGEAPHQKPELPCAFAGVAMPSLAATDPLLLALAILFVMTLVTTAIVPRPFAGPTFLRPPLRGPPILS